jgi:hypothetical protein
MFDEADALTIDKTAMDRTQRTREPEQRKSETLLNDHPNDALMFHGNVLFLPLVLWCSVTLRYEISGQQKNFVP